MTPDKLPSQETLLQELKDQLRRYADIKNSLDNKAKSLIATAGTISIIFVAFGTFIITEIASGHATWSVLLGVVLIGESSIAALAMKSASDAYKAREYRQPIAYQSLWDQENGQMDEETVSQYVTSEQREVYESLILEYILCIKSHQEQNDMQVKDIELAQKRINGAWFAIPIFIVIAVLAKPLFG